MAVRLSPEEKKEKYRLIFEALWDNPWVSERQLTSILGGSVVTTRNRIHEAVSLGYISNPQARKKSHENTRELLYFVRHPNPYTFYTELVNEMKISYHALMLGFCDMWIIADEPIDIDAELVFKGYRSDFHISHPVNKPWRTAISNIHEKIESFNFEKPEKDIIQTKSEKIEWSPDYDILFKYFKFNLRKPRTPVMREYKIATETIDNFFSDLSELCTVFTMYYPEKLEAYEPWLYMIDTEYPNFIVNLFSELPTTSWFFTVNNKLFMFIYPEREILSVIRTSSSLKEIQNLHIPFILYNMKTKGIIKSEEHGRIDGYWQKELHDYSKDKKEI